MKRLRWGILATGKIAGAFAHGVNTSETGELAAVGSRSFKAAEAFCAEYGGQPHGSYEDLLANPDVDAVYIATPHHLHSENVIGAAKAGKAILCEKPFTLSMADGERALEAVRANGVTFMEAFMYRCHPQLTFVRALLAQGAIGPIRHVHAEFGFDVSPDWDNFRLNGRLGGGALMDVGCYCVSLIQLAFGTGPKSAEYRADLALGYDSLGTGNICYEQGYGTFATAVHLELRNEATVYGENGWIHLRSPWKGTPAEVTVNAAGVQEVHEFDLEGRSIYALEADAFARSIHQGESPIMTVGDTCANMHVLELLKQSAALSF